MKTSRKLLFGGVLGAMIVAGLFVNFALSAPGAAPSSSAGCVQQPNGTFMSNGRVCDRVDYTLYKTGLVPYVNPYFYHLIAEGWQFLNYSRGGSFFEFTTHNLITEAGAQVIQNQVHGTTSKANGVAGATYTTYVVQGLGLSTSSSIAATDDAAVGNYPTTGACSNSASTGEITEFLLTRTVGTYTAGTVSTDSNTPPGGTISPTLTATWTATGPMLNVQAGCAWLQSATAYGSGTPGTLFAENTFSAVNLNTGDQLTITWTFTYSG